MVTHMCGPTVAHANAWSYQDAFSRAFRKPALRCRGPFTFAAWSSGEHKSWLRPLCARSIESANSCSRPLHGGIPCFAASRGSFKPNGLTSRLAKVGAPQRTSCAARESDWQSSLMCGERMLAAITMCTPYWYHRQGTREGVRAELPPRGPLARARARSRGNLIQPLGRGNVPTASPRDESSCADPFAFLPRDFRAGLTP